MRIHKYSGIPGISGTHDNSHSLLLFLLFCAEGGHVEEQGHSSRTILSSSIVVDMDLKVTDFYPFNADLSGKFLTCLDQQSLSGKFVFNLLLLKYLTEKRPVHIVSFNSSRNHFDSILRKHVQLLPYELT